MENDDENENDDDRFVSYGCPDRISLCGRYGTGWWTTDVPEQEYSPERREFRRPHDAGGCRKGCRPCRYAVGAWSLHRVGAGQCRLQRVTSRHSRQSTETRK